MEEKSIMAGIGWPVDVGGNQKQECPLFNKNGR